MTSRPLVADDDLARMRFVDPDRHDRAGIRHLYELPLVPAFSTAFDNAHARALYRCELNPRIVGRDPDGSFTLDPTDVVPAELVGWAFHLPWERNPIPANKPSGKSHWTHTYRATAPVKQMGYALARAAKIGPQPRIRVRLDWEVTDRRTRDEDNLVPPMKALVDGIKTAGVVPDDHRTYVLRDMPMIRYAPKSEARPHAFMRLWVWKEPALASK